MATLQQGLYFFPKVKQSLTEYQNQPIQVFCKTIVRWFPAVILYHVLQVSSNGGLLNFNRLDLAHMRNSLCGLLMILATNAIAQVPDDVFQFAMGGTLSEADGNILALDDGGLIMVCESNSPVGGIKSEAIGSYDVWVLRMDAERNIVWDHCYGGGNNEYNPRIVQAGDGGFIIACESSSGLGGSKTVVNYGSTDIWVFKIDSLGSLVWQQGLGGSNTESMGSVLHTSTDQVVLGIISNSGISGTKSVASMGGSDIWIVKLDDSGNIMWQSRAGTVFTEGCGFSAWAERPDGNYLMAAYSNAGFTGDKTVSGYGDYDYWILEFDTNGVIVWQDDLGWTGSDIPNTIISTLDGGFVVGGYSGSSMGGDKSEGSYGSVDFWVLKFGADRLLDWDKTYGGGSSDYGPFALLEWPDQSIVIGGYSTSLPGGNKTAPYIGSSDYWVIRTDETGAIIWQQSFGGSSSDYLYDLVSTNDFGLLITGTSGSGLEGNKTVASAGLQDIWLVELEASDVCPISDITIDTILYNENLTLADGGIADSTGTWVVMVDESGCTITYTYNIQIIRTPVVNFTYSADLLEVSFTDLSENEPDSWLWYFGDGTTSAEQDPVHTYATAGTHAVCLQAGNAAGSAFSCALIEISDATAPVADFSWETIGDTTFFTDLSSPAPTSWIWLFGDGTAGSGQYPTHNYAVSGTYPVCMKAINAGGNDIICQLVDVCVPVQLSIAGTDSLCPGALIFINSTLAEASSFQWFKDGLPYAGAGATASTLMAIDAGSYTMSYTDAAGCTDTTDVINLYDAELPVVTLELENDQLCNQDGLITLSGGMPAGGTYFGPGVTDGVHVNTAMLLPGEYIISYAYGDICTAEATDTIWVNLNPSASATVGSASNNLCVNTPVVLLANSGTGYTYQWYRNNTLLPGETSLAYLASTPGNYQVEVTSAEGCSRLSAKRKVVSSGCREASDADAQFLVFPNPSSGNVQVYYASEKELIGPVLLTILDTQGRMVWQSQPVAQNKMVSETVNTDLPTGMYVIRLQTGTGEQYSESLMITQE